MENYKTVETKMINVNGTKFAYRELGEQSEIPVIFLNHLTANIDDCDPAVIEGIARAHHIIVFDNRGVGRTEGKTPDDVIEMAKDAFDFINALGFKVVDLFGYSLGGFVAQVLAKEHPKFVRKLILAGTAPSGGEASDIHTITLEESLQKADIEKKHPKHFLFFSPSQSSQAAANDFLSRLSERKEDLDEPVTQEVIGAQLTAIFKWFSTELFALSAIEQPTLIVNGDRDAMLPTSNSIKLFNGIPNSKLAIYPDAGHGGIFQYHDIFVEQVVEFLKN
jgi:Predicted hydrolases or acyltransferases (alpha/beta hydrolase superfamily)